MWLGALTGVACGVASAAFLHLLEVATAIRLATPALVFALPLAGALMGWLCERYLPSLWAGNGLVIDTLHDDGPRLPLWHAPAILLATVWTHLFGGSAGREGTAVVMGASLADGWASLFRVDRAMRLELLAAGIAGGFGSVFGTPWAGTMFGLECVVLGRLRYQALIPAVVAAFVGDVVTTGLGVRHTPYPRVQGVEVSPLLALKWFFFAAAVALTAFVFIHTVHALRNWASKSGASRAMRMAAGGFAVLALWGAVGADANAYLGLSVPTLVRAFEVTDLASSAFALKLGFTVLTLGFGFFGGEVTPLFVIGACLGNALAPVLGVPIPLAAGVGMAALFACAANTPLALSIMAVELLGWEVLPHVLWVSVLAYLMSGHRGIYGTQRVYRGKWGQRVEKPQRLQDF